ncbi:hypothetical protein BDV59DRAFT_186668 [Aspergillus ambiguus]|uniref:glutathione synthetase n=1 Tax=Aspergillus ambiguus TaxID=176160 RepID=UPI003CCD9805
MSLFPRYPPPISEDAGLHIAAQIQDWQINHGSMLKDIRSQTAESVLCYPIGVSVFPTPFPRAQFDRALDLQSIYHELYCALAEDEQWISSVIEDLIPVHPLADALWEVHLRVKSSGGYANNTNKISLGIFRSDYMLHVEDERPTDGEALGLKQVEFNTFSCAGASHADKVVDMHHHLARTGAYDCKDSSISTTCLPQNNNIENLASCLAEAHAAYGTHKSAIATQTAVLFVVQPRNFNIADERPLEYALWKQDIPVPAYRVEFGGDVMKYTSLTKSRELLFHPPWREGQPPIEVSVVYFRAGYEAHEYDGTGKDARIQLEGSRAIKCPSLLAHILTFKKVQQCLTAPGALERVLSPEKAAAIRSTFVQIYPMDESPRGLHARKLAMDPATARDYILKPSLEGGGNNVHGEDIPRFLAEISPSSWSAFVLMERIASPEVENVLMSSKGIDLGGVISELGVIGGCLWRRGEILSSSVVGWSFKTKFEDVEEMSVVKGYGCFDTPLLFS